MDSAGAPEMQSVEVAAQEPVSPSHVQTSSCSPDVTPPVITCPATLTFECTYSGQQTVGELHFSDNCGISYISNPPHYIGAPGTATYSVYAQDSSNNTTHCSTVWKVVDTQPPTLVLNGSANMRLPYGTAYQEPGAWGEDGCDGYYYPWLGSRIQVTGSVNPQVPGTYALTYRLADYAGNVTTATRWVTVLSP